MAPSKRKEVEEAESSASVPNKRRKKSVEATASSRRPSRTSVDTSAAPRTTRSSLNGTRSSNHDNGRKPEKAVKAKSSVNDLPNKTTAEKAKTSKARKNRVKLPADEEEMIGVNPKISVDVPQSQKSRSDAKVDHDLELEEPGEGPSYWLMKAEPDSRIEKGKDVKFSIDDLKTATEPEPWDGVRNPTARNNMRLMMKGDLAFFYHSNCKVPGIVGTMEVVREHSTDETAFDPEHPYFDGKSDREKPKWCLVHVRFRQKFPEIIKLKELQKYSKDGGILEHMQMLRQSRLSVSKVTKKEWDFIMGLVDMEDVAVASAQHQPQMVA